MSAPKIVDIRTKNAFSGFRTISSSKDYLNLKSERRVHTGKQPLLEFKINMLTSLKQAILEISDFSVNSDQSEADQELQML